MEENEYHQVLDAIELALAVCDKSRTADDVVRWRLQRRLRELRVGLLCLIEPTEHGDAEVN